MCSVKCFIESAVRLSALLGCSPLFGAPALLSSVCPLLAVFNKGAHCIIALKQTRCSLCEDSLNPSVKQMFDIKFGRMDLHCFPENKTRLSVETGKLTVGLYLISLSVMFLTIFSPLPGPFSLS